MTTKIPYEDYRSSKGLNITHLSKMETSALAFKVNAALEDPDGKEKEVNKDGHALHACCLEHELFEDICTIWPGGFTRPKSGEPKPTISHNSEDYREFKAENAAQGKLVTTQKYIDKCERIRRSVMRHPFSGQLLSDIHTETEISIYWNHRYGVGCKSRIDILGHKVMGDLKFLRDITPGAVNRAILRYNFHAQGSFYQDAVTAETGVKLPYYIIAAEKTEPFDVVVYELDDAVLDLGRQTYQRWMRRYIQCTESGNWPGISDSAIKVEIPNWAYEDEITKGISTDGMEIEG